MIYADNAATTKLNMAAFEAMKPFLLNDYSNPSQPYSFSRNSKKAIKESRRIIADCIGAEPDEIYFTSGGTESDNWAIKKFALSTDAKVIITSNIEHHAILNACESVRNETGVNYLSVDKAGKVNASELEGLLESMQNPCASSRSMLVSIMLANNEIGTIQDISTLASVAHKYGAVFHTDAVQAVGHIDINVKELNVDMLSASAHKFNGPKGIGFLYIKKGTLIEPLINGGHQEKGYRAGTENVASIVGMAVALRESCAKLEQNQKHLIELERRFIGLIDDSGIDYIRNGSENHLPGNINISIKGSNGEMLLHRLDLMGIMVSTGSACDSVNNQVSHVIKAIKVPGEYAEGTIRISLGQENTLEDVDTIATAIVKIVSDL